MASQRRASGGDAKRKRSGSASAPGGEEAAPKVSRRKSSAVDGAATKTKASEVSPAPAPATSGGSSNNKGGRGRQTDQGQGKAKTGGTSSGEGGDAALRRKPVTAAKVLPSQPATPKQTGIKLPVNSGPVPPTPSTDRTPKSPPNNLRILFPFIGLLVAILAYATRGVFLTENPKGAVGGVQSTKNNGQQRSNAKADSARKKAELADAEAAAATARAKAKAKAKADAEAKAKVDADAAAAAKAKAEADAAVAAAAAAEASASAAKAKAKAKADAAVALSSSTSSSAPSAARTPKAASKGTVPLSQTAVVSPATESASVVPPHNEARWTSGSRVTYGESGLFGSSTPSHDKFIEMDVAGIWTGSRVLSSRDGKCRDIQLTSPPLRTKQSAFAAAAHFIGLLDLLSSPTSVPAVVNRKFSLPARPPPLGDCYCMQAPSPSASSLSSLSIVFHERYINVHKIMMFFRPDDVGSAPKRFHLLGWPEDPVKNRRRNKPLNLGAFEAIPVRSSSSSSSSSGSSGSSSGSSALVGELQSFEVPGSRRNATRGFRAITIQVATNNGDTNKTCIYRVQVLGDVIARKA